MKMKAGEVLSPQEVRNQYPHFARFKAELVDRAEMEGLMLRMLFWESSFGKIGATLIPVAQTKSGEWKEV